MDSRFHGNDGKTSGARREVGSGGRWERVVVVIFTTGIQVFITGAKYIPRREINIFRVASVRIQALENGTPHIWRCGRKTVKKEIIVAISREGDVEIPWTPEGEEEETGKLAEKIGGREEKIRLYFGKIQCG